MVQSYVQYTYAQSHNIYTYTHAYTAQQTNLQLISCQWENERRSRRDEVVEGDSHSLQSLNAGPSASVAGLGLLLLILLPLLALVLLVVMLVLLVFVLVLLVLVLVLLVFVLVLLLSLLLLVLVMVVSVVLVLLLFVSCLLACLSTVALLGITCWVFI